LFITGVFGALAPWLAKKFRVELDRKKRCANIGAGEDGVKLSVV
jgi:hypothetical protein